MTEKIKPVLLWITGIGIVALLVYFIGFKNQKETAHENQVTVDLINVNENNVTVAAFIRFMEEDTMKMELDDTFTREASLKLIDATNAMADEIRFDVSANMDRVVKYVNRTLAAPIETSEANDFKSAADILTSTILKSMQQAKYPGLSSQVTELENASASINPDVLTLDQKDKIKIFFKEAADLLRKMN